MKRNIKTTHTGNAFQQNPSDIIFLIHINIKNKTHVSRLKEFRTALLVEQASIDLYEKQRDLIENGTRRCVNCHAQCDRVR